eukprot:1252508-Pyramimonas_sp.AAC.1
MAAQQALKEHAREALSLEPFISSQFPPGSAPSAEVQTAVAQPAEGKGNGGGGGRGASRIDI